MTTNTLCRSFAAAFLLLTGGVSLIAGQVIQQDGITLLVNHSQTSGSVYLSWTGEQPPYDVLIDDVLFPGTSPSFSLHLSTSNHTAVGSLMGSSVFFLVRSGGCNDGVANGDETSVDCGGSCAPCPLGAACSSDADCASHSCSGTCQMETCGDGAQNGGETDVDCGGPLCTGCGLLGKCVTHTDCQSGSYCSKGTCLSDPVCRNGIVDGTETDVDCGGPDCSTCTPGQDCAIGPDCDSGICNSGTCAGSGCSDGVSNGTETDVDCGGTCPPCPPGGSCRASGPTPGGPNSDCASGYCSMQKCVPASCMNDMLDTGETSVDCGGPDCSPCPPFQNCIADADCASGTCSAGTCGPHNCRDGAQNGFETDVDCGGISTNITCRPCGVSTACQVDSDCFSGLCADSTCRPIAVCRDGIRNGTETDIDCGGGDCSRCQTGRMCAIDADCVGGLCMSGECQPTCTDGITNQDETDVDCGGSICGQCDLGESCNVDLDCVSGSCEIEPSGGSLVCT